MTSCGHCQRSCLTYDGDGASFGHPNDGIGRRLRRRTRVGGAKFAGYLHLIGVALKT